MPTAHHRTVTAESDGFITPAGLLSNDSAAVAHSTTALPNQKNVGNGKLRREGDRTIQLMRIIRIFMHRCIFFFFHSFVPPVFDARQRLK
jgi:hypothetical protein